MCILQIFVHSQKVYWRIFIKTQTVTEKRDQQNYPRNDSRNKRLQKVTPGVIWPLGFSAQRVEGTGVRRKTKRKGFFVLFWKNKRKKTRFFLVDQETGYDELDLLFFFHMDFIVRFKSKFQGNSLSQVLKKKEQN